LLLLLEDRIADLLSILIRASIKISILNVGRILTTCERRIATSSAHVLQLHLGDILLLNVVYLILVLFLVLIMMVVNDLGKERIR